MTTSLHVPSRLVALVLAVGFIAVAGCRAQEAPPPESRLKAEDGSTGQSMADTTPERAPSDSLHRLAAMQDSGRVALPAATQADLVAQDSLWHQALRLHYRTLVVDGHVDTPLLMLDEDYTLAERHSFRRAHLDLPRMEQGGLDAPFFSIYVAPYYGNEARAVGRARAMIDEVTRQVEATDEAELATTAEDIRRIARSGRAAILLGLEGGHALAASPDTLRALADAGIRYVTLTHVNTNRWADSSQDDPRHGGLTDLGREMVRTMNEEGVLVDLAHVSDATFSDALAVSSEPVIVSHSSCRHLTPTVRNVSDEQLRAVAENGGVVMINFFDAMVNPALDSTVFAAAHRQLEREGKGLRSLWSAVYDVKRARDLSGARLSDVLDHIDHAVEVAGVDHVALGSDFDGVFDLPQGLEDVTRLPWITYGLLKRGYTEAEITKILGGNTLRVLQAAGREGGEGSG
jgi:membrane dipeptidase